MKKNLIIDTDPGIDDAVAIAIALFSEKYNINLISTVAGNVDVEKTTLNARRLLKFFNKEHIPIVKGASSPLIEKLVVATNVHGLSGLEGWDFEEPDKEIVNENFLEYMYKTIMNQEENTTILAIGPLTNIALLLKVYPEVKRKIEKIVFMGGSLTRGNKGVMSEFNIAVDPEAAHIVIHSRLPIVMASLDIGMKALIYKEDSEKIKLQNKTGEMIYSLFKKYRGGTFNTGLKMYDSTAVAYLLKPELFEITSTYVDIELKGDMTKGTTIVDLKGYLKKETKNVDVITDVDENSFRKWFIEALNKCN